MWAPAARWQHSRAGLRYASDLTDAEWAVLEPLLPPAPRRGRRRAWPEREIVNAIFYVLRAGCAWRLLPSPRHCRGWPSGTWRSTWPRSGGYGPSSRTCAPPTRPPARGDLPVSP